MGLCTWTSNLIPLQRSKRLSRIGELQVTRPTRFCYRICFVLMASLTVTPLTVGGLKPKKDPTKWRDYKFKEQDIKEAEKECDHGGRPLPEMYQHHSTGRRAQYGPTQTIIFQGSEYTEK